MRIYMADKPVVERSAIVIPSGAKLQRSRRSRRGQAFNLQLFFGRVGQWRCHSKFARSFGALRRPQDDTPGDVGNSPRFRQTTIAPIAIVMTSPMPNSSMM